MIIIFELSSWVPYHTTSTSCSTYLPAYQFMMKIQILGIEKYYDEAGKIGKELYDETDFSSFLQ